MHPFRPTNTIWFLLSISILLLWVISLQYYRPSSYLPEPDPSYEFQAEEEVLDQVFQLAEDWEHAHETPQVFDEEDINPLPKIPDIPSFADLDEEKLNPGPEPETDPFNDDSVISKKEDQESSAEDDPNKESSTDQADSDGWWVFLENYKSYLYWWGLLLAIPFVAGMLSSIARRTIQNQGQREVNAIPVGIARKKYQISRDFQSDTIDQTWLNNIHQEEEAYLQYANDGKQELHYEDYLKTVTKDRGFQVAPSDKTQYSLVEKGVHHAQKWLDPDKRLVEPFKFSFTWSDIWAILSSAAYESLLILLLPKDDFLLLPMVLGYFFLLILQMGLFRRSSFSYYVFGIAATVITGIGWLGLGLYWYIEAHPEMLEGDADYTWLWILGPAILLYLFARPIAKNRYVRHFINHTMVEPIWLRDASFGNVAVIFLLMGFSSGTILNWIGLWDLSYIIRGPIWASFTLNIIGWLFSPLQKEKAANQWRIGPMRLLLFIIASLLATGFLIYNEWFYSLLWWVAPVPMISGIIYLFGFYRTNQIKAIQEKNEASQKEKNLQQQVEAVEEDAKELLRPKVVQTAPQVHRSERWWDLEDPNKTGLLHLEYRGLGQKPEELDQLLKFKNLRFLYLQHNNLQFVPDELIWLKELRKLDLSDNSIRFLPPQLFSQLQELSILELANNELKSIPSTIAQLPKLKVLNIKGNPISTTTISQLKGRYPHLQIESD